MKENKNMNNEADNNNFNNNEGGIVMMTGTMTMDVFAGTVNLPSRKIIPRVRYNLTTTHATTY